MAQTLVERQVLFCGIWRPRNSMDEYFHRTVNQQFQRKPGAQASYRLTTEGLTILVSQSESGRQGQTDQIPVQVIKEVTVNRYNPLCLMTLYLDQARRFNVLVCRCKVDQDAALVVRVFQQLWESSSGQGYSIHLKQPESINWMLKTKENGENGSVVGEDLLDVSNNSSIKSGEDGSGSGVVLPDNRYETYGQTAGVVMVEKAEEALERESLEVAGRPCYNVGVQADLETDDDTVSITSTASYQSLRDEVTLLTNEVRDIKLLLEQTTGISAEEFFRRGRDPGVSGLVSVKRTVSHDSNGNGEKRVNFASLPGEDGGDGNDTDDGEEGDMDFDIRSVGMQTANSWAAKRGKYQKRVRLAITPNKYQQISRNRSGSSSSSIMSSLPASPQPSPFTPSRPHDGPVFSYPTTQRYVDVRRDPRFASAALSRSLNGNGLRSGRLVRPIQSVYTVHSPGFKQARRQVVVLPNRSSSMPRHIRRSATDVAPDQSHENGGGAP